MNPEETQYFSPNMASNAWPGLGLVDDYLRRNFHQNFKTLKFCNFDCVKALLCTDEPRVGKLKRDFAEKTHSSN